MSKKQMVWHAFHAGSLCQMVDLEARRAEIEEIKPPNELPTRRRLMKPVIGQLPMEFVGACEAWEATREAAWEAWEAAREAREAAWGTAREAREAAWGTAREAWEAAYTKHKAEIERLHAVECPNCPWDGESIL